MLEVTNFLLAFIDAANKWFADHQPLMVAVALPLLTMWVTQKSAKSSEQRATQSALIDRKLRSEMRVAEFRQEWINNLRSTIVELAEVCSENDPTANKFQLIIMLTLRAELMMNPKDQDYTRLTEIFDRMRQGDVTDLSGNLRDVFQSILKREWDRLKEDLARVEAVKTP